MFSDPGTERWQETWYKEEERGNVVGGGFLCINTNEGQTYFKVSCVLV